MKPGSFMESHNLVSSSLRDIAKKSEGLWYQQQRTANMSSSRRREVRCVKRTRRLRIAVVADAIVLKDFQVDGVRNKLHRSVPVRRVHAGGMRRAELIVDDS